MKARLIMSPNGVTSDYKNRRTASKRIEIWVLKITVLPGLLHHWGQQQRYRSKLSVDGSLVIVLIDIQTLIKEEGSDCREGLAVTISYCSSRAPEFGSQDPYHRSWANLWLQLQDLAPSTGLCGHPHTHAHDHTHTHTHTP